MNFARFLSSISLGYLLLFSASSLAQTLYLIGGSLKTCSSQSTQNCSKKVNFESAAKRQQLFFVHDLTLNAVNEKWPTHNTQHKHRTRKLLKAIKSKMLYSKSELIAAIKQQDSYLYKRWSNEEYYFVFDMLEVPVLYEQRRAKEQVLTQFNNEPASTEILNDIVKTLKQQNNAKLLLSTASSRDPYESADFYQGLFSAYGVEATWFALTPALAKAISNNDCDNLDIYRNKLNNVFNRELVYPDLTAQELALCKKGIDNLTQEITSAGGMMFNGGDQSLTKQVMVDNETGKAFPWLKAIQNRPVLIGTSAGTAVQSGGQNASGQVPMITNGTSLSALESGAFAKAPPKQNCQQHGGCDILPHDALTYDKRGGLGSFNFGILDTHFSERGRTPRLAVLLAETNQRWGFGVDETTALKVEKAVNKFSVLGKKGVVLLEKVSKYSFLYNFYPASSEFMLNPNVENFAEIKINGRVGHSEDLISDALIRERLKVFCTGDISSLVNKEQGIKNNELIFRKLEQTSCELLGQSMKIENLLMKINSLSKAKDN
ncbi:cyanophycinase [Pseudoalteromonas phenolica]|uniref:cyanophycinase n=1 Tax=Pseudoalteromonas phenolica TaxID=161398 RepID=UPI00110BB144|nr:cyanophycinase [Pseudoalteromonas phenolica]TMN86945.1 cyanophycinase [Pseudoalteromonas phenolica]